MFFILFVAGNAMAQSVRERINELAVLKTLGFGDGRILSLVLLESCTDCRSRRRPGIAALVDDHQTRWRPDRRAPSYLSFPPRDLILGVLLVAALGVCTGLDPGPAGEPFENRGCAPPRVIGRLS